MDEDLKAIDMKPLFFPKTIAVIGVSKNKVSGLKFVLANYMSGYVESGGKVFPINPKYKEIEGYKIYPSLFDPEVPDIDLAIIAVPAENVPNVVRDCGKKRVKFAIIFSSGFGESGLEDLEIELRKAVKEVNKYTRFIGPNCLGVHNPYSKVCYYPGSVICPGNVSYVSMSGGHTGRLSHWLVSQGTGVNNIVSIGNSVDLTAIDFVNYFREDPVTKVIALYLESIPDGRKFMKVLKETTKIKPIIIWKGGQTEEGQKATKSHTGGLAGSIEMWKAMAKQTGVILADHFEFFADAVTAFSVKYKLPKDEKVCILACGGGIAIEYSDLCIKNGLKIPELSEVTKKELGEVFPPVNTSFTNPVDLGEYGYIPYNFDKALRIVAKDPNISSILFVREAERFVLFQNVLGIPNMEKITIDLMNETTKLIDKPLFCSTSPNSQEVEHYTYRYTFKEKMLKIDVPVSDLIANTCRIIKEMVAYNNYLKRNAKVV